MEKLKVKTADLVKVLKENRQKHVLEYKEAVRQYRLRAAEALTRELDKCTSGKKFETNLNMGRPASHEKDYDLIIRMLQMSVEEITVLDHHEFNQFVLDEWSWKPGFQSSSYGASGSYGTSGSTGYSGSSGTSGTSGIKYVDKDEPTKPEKFITVNFSGDELYEEPAGNTGSTGGFAGSSGVFSSASYSGDSPIGTSGQSAELKAK